MFVEYSSCGSEGSAAEREGASDWAVDSAVVGVAVESTVVGVLVVASVVAVWNCWLFLCTTSSASSGPVLMVVSSSGQVVRF